MPLDSSLSLSPPPHTLYVLQGCLSQHGRKYAAHTLYSSKALLVISSQNLKPFFPARQMVQSISSMKVRVTVHNHSILETTVYGLGERSVQRKKTESTANLPSP